LIGVADATQEIISAVRQARMAAASAVMRIEVTGDIGYLFFLEGELVHASTLDLEGEPAVYEILAWHEGRLAWCERRWPRERSVLRDWNELVNALPAAPSVTTAEQPETEPQALEPEPVRPGASEVHLPSAFGLRQALSRADFKNALRLTQSGNVSDSRGNTAHLKPILRATVSLGDSLGAALGLGLLIGAEATAPGFHRLIARSVEDSCAVETMGGSSLQLARAFLKL
jgi:hypothetical protein